MIKIVITGPESTGKTSIAHFLGKKMKMPVVNEFAVEYLKKTKGNYKYSDLLKIGKGQIQAEEMLINNVRPQILICDTDLITIKIWSQVKFKKVNKQILSMIDSRFYDHYILCAPDIEWEYSEFRENPNDRDVLFDLYEKELKAYGKKYTILKGIDIERYLNAIKIFDNVLEATLRI